jgi:hypothetical protein
LATPLSESILLNHTNIALLLLNNNADIVKSDRNPLNFRLIWEAIKNRNKTLTEELLKRGALPALPDEDEEHDLYNETVTSFKNILHEEYDAHHRRDDIKYRISLQKLLTSQDPDQPKFIPGIAALIVRLIPKPRYVNTYTHAPEHALPGGGYGGLD